MRTGWIPSLLLTLTMALPRAWAGEASPHEAATRAEEAAAALLLAARTDDKEGFHRRAADEAVDGWLVTHALLAADREVASAYVSAREALLLDWREQVGQAEGPARRALRHYLASLKDSPIDAAERRLVGEAEQLEAAGKFDEALQRARNFKRTDLLLAARLDRVQGRALSGLGQTAQAHAALVRAAELAATLGWLEQALRTWDEAAEQAQGVGPEAQTLALLNAARLHLRLGRTRGTRLGDQTHEGIERATSRIERAVALALEGENAAGAATILEEAYAMRRDSWSPIGEEIWDHPLAAGWLERALGVWESLGRTEDALRVAELLAQGHEAAGAYVAAIHAYETALSLAVRLCSETGDESMLGMLQYESHEALAAIHARAGDPAGEMRALKRWAASLEGGPEPSDVLQEMVLMTAADLQARLGDLGGAIQRAREFYERHEQAQDEFLGQAALRLAGFLREAGQATEALALYRRALEFPPLALEAAAGLAQVLLEIGEPKQAAAFVASWLAEHAELAGPFGQRRLEILAARAYAAAGDLAQGLVRLEALAPQDAASPHARREPATAQIAVEALAALARVRLAGNDAAGALAAARQALLTPRFLASSSIHEGGPAGQAVLEALAVGAQAAAQLGDAPAAFEMLERGRAQGLGAALGRLAHPANTVVPEALKTAEARVRAEQAQARARLAAAKASGNREAVRAAQAQLLAHDTSLRGVVAAMQALATAGASRLPVAPLKQVQALLLKDDALVLYGLQGSEGLAVVVTTEGPRVVRLGRTAPLVATTETLVTALRDPKRDPASALRDAGERLIGPLQLPESIRRVFVSPEGALCSIPMGVLLGGRKVLVVPSATTLAALSARDHPRGEGVLALGDPDYATVVSPEAIAIYRARAGGALLPLPGTRAEVEAVGDVRLLGRDASETALRAAMLEPRRWRAIHLACHGLLDEQVPLCSSLALAATELDDGFLSVLDVSGLRLMADLVVLSACDTARGTHAQGEGVLGLPRAFLLAGAPCVLGSLWPVDDAATHELMVRFYERWAPDAAAQGVSAEQALREAQEAVRGQSGFSHPYYWAAWVLWGAPE